MNIWLAYGLASAATIGFAAFSRDRDLNDKKLAALALFCGWLATNLGYWNRQSIAYPIIDVGLGYVFLTLHLNDPRPWKLHLFGIGLLMAIAHVTYQSALLFGLQIGYAYRTVLNALFVCQLWIVAKDGMRRGFDRIDWSVVPARIGFLRAHGFARSKDEA